MFALVSRPASAVWGGKRVSGGVVPPPPPGPQNPFGAVGGGGGYRSSTSRASASLKGLKLEVIPPSVQRELDKKAKEMEEAVKAASVPYSRIEIDKKFPMRDNDEEEKAIITLLLLS